MSDWLVLWASVCKRVRCSRCTTVQVLATVFKIILHLDFVLFFSKNKIHDILTKQNFQAWVLRFELKKFFLLIFAINNNKNIINSSLSLLNIYLIKLTIVFKFKF